MISIIFLQMIFNFRADFFGVNSIFQTPLNRIQRTITSAENRGRLVTFVYIQSVSQKHEQNETAILPRIHFPTIQKPQNAREHDENQEHNSLRRKNS